MSVASSAAGTTALPQSTPAPDSGPLPPPLPTREQAAAAGAGAAGWWGKFRAAVKRLKKEVLALHYANQVSAMSSGKVHKEECLVPLGWF